MKTLYLLHVACFYGVLKVCNRVLVGLGFGRKGMTPPPVLTSVHVERVFKPRLTRSQTNIGSTVSTSENWLLFVIPGLFDLIRWTSCGAE